MSQPKLTLAHIQETLKDVQFMDRTFLAMEKGDGFLIQMSYMEADICHPEAGLTLQKTRKWYASPYMTESELVETVWAMVVRSQMHVTAEHFMYKGRRVYSPHFDVQARIEMCDAERFDCREPIVQENPVKPKVIVSEDRHCHPDVGAELCDSCGGIDDECFVGTLGCSGVHQK